MKINPVFLALIAVLTLSACNSQAEAGTSKDSLIPFITAETSSAIPAGTNPILFVTQVPIAEDFTTIGSTFGNHLAAMEAVGRGGDLWIRYSDGSLKNLTAAAGYGSRNPDGFQGADAIAVRDPDVYWDGQKAVFSMVVGAPVERYEVKTFYWQLYEITGLGQNETPVISKLPNQPQNFNNVSPIYGSDERIIFTSDRPRDGAAHLYPQLDEYEEAPTNSGLWSLDPQTGDLRLLHHAPSGAFTPLIDSYGRLLFTNWDHLQRDQQADGDNEAAAAGAELPYGTFNYSDESAASVPLFNDREEVFPEPRTVSGSSDLNEHSFNHFFPWQIREDGTESEVLNHIGRHELHDYFTGSFNNDPNIVEFTDADPRFNPHSILNMFHIAEDPLQHGLYYGIDAPEFGTHGAGNIISLSAPPTLDADHIAVTTVTDPEHGDGRYRSPLPLANGSLAAVYTDTKDEHDSGSGVNSDFVFRLALLEKSGSYWTAAAFLTPGIEKTIRFWSPDNEMVYSGVLWELNPVEVRVRERPSVEPLKLPAPEQTIFDQAQVDLAALQAYLRANDLALVVSRNVTSRDDADRQQPFNLRIAGSATQTSGAPGKIYDISYMQFLQGDQIRGLTGCCGATEPVPGRRVLAQFMHDAQAINANPPSSGPPGSVALAGDGSMAAFVPANRAMSWQLTDPDGQAVVRERYWLTFQPGEVRVCAACHGLNEKDQAQRPMPQNPPQALLQLLQYWQENQ